MVNLELQGVVDDVTQDLIRKREFHLLIHLVPGWV